MTNQEKLNAINWHFDNDKITTLEDLCNFRCSNIMDLKDEMTIDEAIDLLAKTYNTVAIDFEEYKTQHPKTKENFEFMYWIDKKGRYRKTPINTMYFSTLHILNTIQEYAQKRVIFDE